MEHAKVTCTQRNVDARLNNEMLRPLRIGSSTGPCRTVYFVERALCSDQTCRARLKPAGWSACQATGRPSCPRIPITYTWQQLKLALRLVWLEPVCELHEWLSKSSEMLVKALVHLRKYRAHDDFGSNSCYARAICQSTCLERA